MHTVGIGASDTGKKRTGNEDVLLVDNDLGLYIVCDGMGGHAGGEVAARMTIDVVASYVRDNAASVARVRDGQEPHTVLEQLLETAVRDACRTVYKAAMSQPGYAGMGTTLTALVVAGSRAVMAHVGDTRLYLVRNGSAHQLSSDHTMVTQAVQSGMMTLEQARKSRFAHVLTRAIGSQEMCPVDTLVFDTIPGDRLILCSDGLTEYVEGQGLLNHLAGDLESIPGALIDVANAAGGRDNITVIAIDIAGPARPAGPREASDARPLAPIAAPQMSARLDALASTFLCRDLGFSHLQRIANRCEVRTFQPGDTLFCEGQPADGLMVIVSGRATVTRDEQTVGEVDVGDCLGVPFLFHDRPAAATVRAAEPTTGMFLSRERLFRLAAIRPWFGVKILTRLGRWCSNALARAARDRTSSRPYELV